MPRNPRTSPLLLLAAALALSAATARGVTVVWGADINNVSDPNGDASQLCSSSGVIAFLVYYGNTQPPSNWGSPTPNYASGSDVLDCDNGIAPVFDPWNQNFTAYLADSQGIIWNQSTAQQVTDPISGPFYVEYHLSQYEMQIGSFFNGSANLANTLEVDDAEGYWRIIIYDPYNALDPNEPGTYGYFDAYITANDYVKYGDDVTLHLNLTQGQWPVDYIEVGVVPEPATAVLLCLGTAIFGLRRHRT